MNRIRLDSSGRMPLEPILAPVPLRAPAAPSPYVELDLRSYYSFLQAGAGPEVLVRRAAELGYDCIGLTDRDGLYGMVRALEEAEKTGIRLIVGCELTLGGHPPHASLWVYVENHLGYTNLCKILTESHRLHPKGQPRLPEEGVPRNCYAGIPVDFVAEHAEGLWAAVDLNIQFLGPKALSDLRQAFGSRLSLRTYRHMDGEDQARENFLLALAPDLPVLATNAVRYALPEQKPLLDLVTCIREGITLDRAGRLLTPNAEAHLKGPAEVARLFADHPQWVARSRQIADSCRFSMRELRYHFPSELEAEPGETPLEALRRLTYAGALTRYPRGVPDTVTQQLEKELTLIKKCNVAPFFLSVHQIVGMARKRDILCQGRGSAANSAVCYCLGITAVDPARSNLLFERFLSAERAEPPDIDVDFEHERREEVIQDIYQTYGRERAAMVSEVICYRGKSALRDVGKALGLSLEQVDRLSGVVSWRDQVEGVARDRLEGAGFDPEDPRLALAIRFAQKIQGFPRHLSIHVGGFVLSSTPLVQVAPVEPATMKDRTVIPWDKDDIDTLGFFKVDVLGLGMLSAIRRALALVGQDQRICAPTAIERLAKIPAEDPEVYESLCQADSVGVFQVESRAQMAMLPRLLPRKFYDLVVQVAIVRPGPIQGGMVHPYLRRRAGEDPVEYPHEILKPILERTLGVPIFQEQVMQIAIEGAGYTGGEADQLRRDMAAWKKHGNLERHQGKLTAGFLARGISQRFADQLYEQMKGFGEYGFPESHAASFALLVYASTWLKYHHPAAFAAALVNSQPMGFYSPNTLLQDAKRHGVQLLPILIDQSDWDCTLPEPNQIRVGLRLIKGLGEAAGRRIEAARTQKKFSSVEDLAQRAGLEATDLEVLAEAGALEPLVAGRRQALWKVLAPVQRGLFAAQTQDQTEPKLAALNRVEQLNFDFARTGVSLDDHPMALLRAQLPRKIKNSRDLSQMLDGSRVTTAGWVICRQRPQTASGIVFLTLEDEHGFVNLVFHSHVFEDNYEIVTGNNLLEVTGKLERTQNVIHVLVKKVRRLTPTTEVPNLSRDFH